MRTIGLDVHREFAEVAILEEGRVRAAGRVETTPEALRLFAQSLAATDEVAIEATVNTFAIARLLEQHVARVVISNPLRTRAIAEAKVKTDKVDARVLAELLAAGYLPGIWRPDEELQALRRLVARRSGIVRERTRLKNQVQAILHRNLAPRCPAADLFGRKGRAWLGEQPLPVDEEIAVASALRRLDVAGEELVLVERQLAQVGLQSEDVKRLLTIPGVDRTVALSLVAAIGEIAPLLGLSPARQLPRPRSARASVRQSARPPRADLQAGPGAGARDAGRGRVGMREDAGPATRFLPARAGPPRRAGGCGRDRAQAGRALLASALPRRGLRLRSPLARRTEAPSARARGRRALTPRPARLDPCVQPQGSPCK
jgi:transposase